MENELKAEIWNEVNEQHGNLMGKTILTDKLYTLFIDVCSEYTMWWSDVEYYGIGDKYRDSEIDFELNENESLFDYFITNIYKH